MMRILGLDVGTKRVGVAISDLLGITAQGMATLERNPEDKLLEDLATIAKEEGVKEIVIGLPINMNGTEGEGAITVRSFAKVVEEKLKLPIKLWDERMTTMEAKRVMIDADISRQKRKKHIDKLAAQLILQSYLATKG